MAINTYDIGDIVRCAAAFTDTAGVAVDPTEVTFRIVDPAGVVTIYIYLTDNELLRLAAGSYYVDVTPTLDGRHYWRFESTGAGQAAGDTAFYVRRSIVLEAGEPPPEEP